MTSISRFVKLKTGRIINLEQIVTIEAGEMVRTVFFNGGEQIHITVKEAAELEEFLEIVNWVDVE